MKKAQYAFMREAQRNFTQKRSYVTSPETAWQQIKQKEINDLRID